MKNRKIGGFSNDQLVFQRISGRGPKYISPDADVHSGGVWKGANTVKDLFNKSTRLGTYDANLNWIGK